MQITVNHCSIYQTLNKVCLTSIIREKLIKALPAPDVLSEELSK